MNSEVQLSPNYSKFQRSAFDGERKKYKITFTPKSVAGPGEELVIRVPKLDMLTSIIPNTFALSFEFTNKNTKSRFNNNLAACLVERLKIKIGSVLVYDNSRQNTLDLFKDKWWSSGFLSSRIENGIAAEGVRKVMSGDDSATNGATTNSVLNTELAERYKRLRIPLGHILNDHGLFAPYKLGFDVEYRITLAPAEKIMTAQSSQSVDGYELKNLMLEYDTIRNENLAMQAFGSFSNKFLVFEDIEHVRNEPIAKGATLVNLNFHKTTSSLAYLLLLFKYADQIDDEEFIYPNIDKAEVTINGKPNSIFSQGMDVSDMHQEAKEVFYHEDKLHAAGFLKDRFCVVFDFKSVRDKSVSNTGAKVDGTSGIQVTLHRRATAKDVICICYFVAHKAISMTQLDVQSVST